MITIEDLQKIELKVAKILAAERVEGSEKLLKLQVDLGSEQRQIVSGIAKAYSPESIIGKEIIIVANLEPRTLMGLESNGMLLAAGSDNGLPAQAGPVLLIPDHEVPPGSGVK